MNEQIKTFSIVVITVCVFIMTVIDILEMIETKKERATATTTQGTVSGKKPNMTPEQLASQPKTTIQFDEMKFDFGEMVAGDNSKHKFSFTNTGSNPLVISDAHGSCGCTIPSYSKEPIPPGGKGEIDVEFNSKGQIRFAK
jgi:hypothetical protein